MIPWNSWEFEMKADPIVEEVHRFRQVTSKRFANDLQAICEDARKRQAAGGRKSIRLAPRPAKPYPAKAG
jgi:hypothetical protein